MPARGGQIIVFLFRATSPTGATPLKALKGAGAGGPQTPGCALFPEVFLPGVTPADLTIDNAGRHYFLTLVMPTWASATCASIIGFRSARRGSGELPGRPARAPVFPLHRGAEGVRHHQ
jgi:hypothetical protein